MKNILILILAGALCSCAVLQRNISPVVSLAASEVLNRAVSESDLEKKKETILKVSEALNRFQFEAKPGYDDVYAYVRGKLPAGAHWDRLTERVTDFYSDSTANIEDNDVKAVKEILFRISKGLESAVETYTTSQK